MTRWSLRRRLGGTRSRDAKREYRPVTAEPAAGRPSTAQPPAGQPGTDQAPSARPGSAPPAGWFEPGWGRQPLPGAGPYVGESAAGAYGQGQPGNAAPYRAGRPGDGQHNPGQHNPGQHNPGQHNPGQHSSSPYSAGQPAAPSPYGAAQPAPAQPAPGQYGAGQYGGGLLSGAQPANGVAVLAPASSPPAQPPAPAPGWDAANWLGHEEHGDKAEQRPGGAWPDICDQFGLHLLVLAEQLRTSLDELESDEDDPERLRRLYQVDHAVARMRRASRDLRTLAGRSEEELAGFTTSLLDVIRMALSAIERYTQVTIGRVTDLAVLGYAADDIGSVMAALLDNATRYSPGTVTVSGHLLDDGGVMFRIEDTGIGMSGEQVAALNAAFTGPVTDVDERTGRHTGFPVVHRIARKHAIGIRLAARPLPSSGTVAMVTLPPHLLCEVPADDAQRRLAQAAGTQAQQAQQAQQAPRPSVVPDLPRGEPTRAHEVQQWEPPQLPDRDQRSLSELPRRERASLRGDEPRPQSQEPAVVRTPEQQAAARRAFADELSAFSLGAVDSTDSADTATEEEAKP
jgi:Histidine kinase-, DNA gyrase B-, and HSP90-like ATPase